MATPSVCNVDELTHVGLERGRFKNKSEIINLEWSYVVRSRRKIKNSDDGDVWGIVERARILAVFIQSNVASMGCSRVRLQAFVRVRWVSWFHTL